MKILLLLLIGLYCMPQAAGFEAKYLVYFRDKGVPGQPFLQKASEHFQKAEEKLAPRSIQRRMKSMGREHYVTIDDVPVLLEYIRDIEAQGVQIHQTLKWFNAVSCYLTQRQLEQVMALPYVSRVERVRTLRSRAGVPSLQRSSDLQWTGSNPGLHAIDYGPSYDQFMLSDIPPVHDLGFYGQGVIIGMLDAGFNTAHQAFAQTEVLAEWDFVGNDPVTAREGDEDPYGWGHGTFAFSLCGAYEEGDMVAPAFGADFVLAKTERVEYESHIEEDNYAAALEWMDSIGVDIATSSVGYTLFDDSTYSYTYKDMDGNTTIVARASNLAFERGIVTVTSAGNEALNEWHYIGSPADAFEIISVGAVDDRGRNTSWSSRGPTFERRLKPEVCAQGEGVGYAAVAEGGYFQSNGVWGTSGAAPIVAGIVGQLLSAYPHLTNLQARSIILEAGDQSGNPDTIRGYGLLSAARALGFPNLREEDGGYSVSKIFAGNVPTIPSTAVLRISTDGSTFSSNAMISGGGAIVTCPLPVAQLGTEVWFHFTYRDSSGADHRDPLEGDYRFTYGDLIVHRNVEVVTTVGREGERALGYVLSQNYPNPFNPATTIQFALPVRSWVNLKVFNLLGEEVAVLLDEGLEAGYRQVRFDAGGLASGVYYYTLRAHPLGAGQGKSFAETKPMVIVR